MPAGLLERFEETWGRAPTHVVRAPGRVNVIGEHIDYCGLSVLPMAIQRALCVAFRPVARPELRVASTAPGAAPGVVPLTLPIAPGPPGDWVNYARAAAQAVLEPGADGRPARHPAVGLDLLVGGDLPIAAGLSSSSALVVACALAVLVAQGDDGTTAWSAVEGEEPARLTLADLLARGERYVGTAGGGMDQAACLLGRAGHVLRVEFAPLAVLPVRWPPEWHLVIAHSGQRAEKSGPAQAVYNARAREAREAIVRVADALGAGRGPRAATVEAGCVGGAPYQALLRDPGPEALLAAGRGALDETLFRRFRHIVVEAARVGEAETALRDVDLARTGRLLGDSHASLRDDYEVSTPRLDRLVEVALEAGAAGARLTGAGLGGCILALCRADGSGALRRALSRDLRHDATYPAPFVARASPGAVVEII